MLVIQTVAVAVQALYKAMPTQRKIRTLSFCFPRKREVRKDKKVAANGRRS